MNDQNHLARKLGLGILALYGIGDILGAGIYVLVGKVAATAGQGAWISFLISALLAGLTGLTYAELASRVPKSAGAAAYSAAAFRPPVVSFLIGFFVLTSGLTSAAAVSLALHGYLTVFIHPPALAAAVLLVFLFGWLAYRGIEASAWTNAVLTLIELAGLLVVVAVGFLLVSKLPVSQLVSAATPDLGAAAILGGATLAFYAFVGFEDLANLAEEAKNPVRDIPRAILIAVAVSTIIYLAIILVVLWTVGPLGAAQSERPLLEVLSKAGRPVPAPVFAAVAMVAIANTGLTNFVMVTRLLYGMAAQGLLPRVLGTVHPLRKTPWVAVWTAGLLVILLAATGGVRLLAQTTSLLLVLVFGTLHVALLRLRRAEAAPAGSFRSPRWSPWAGLLTCVLLCFYFPAGVYLRTAVVAVLGLALFAALNRPIVSPVL